MAQPRARFITCLEAVGLVGTLRAYARDRRGIAAVEFALIGPILILLWLGGVEITNLLILDRKLNSMTTSISDLVDRSNKVTETDIETIFDIVSIALNPFDATAVGIRVSAMEVDESSIATVSWSHSRGDYDRLSQGAGAGDLVDAGSMSPGMQIIVAEVTYDYKPQFGFVLTGPIKANSTAAMPRLSRA